MSQLGGAAVKLLMVGLRSHCLHIYGIVNINLTYLGFHWNWRNLALFFFIIHKMKTLWFIKLLNIYLNLQICNQIDLWDVNQEITRDFPKLLNCYVNESKSIITNIFNNFCNVFLRSKILS